jgi:hypothetical protein
MNVTHMHEIPASLCYTQYNPLDGSLQERKGEEKKRKEKKKHLPWDLFRYGPSKLV